MQEVPNWIITVIQTETLQCRKCKVQFGSDNLMSISVQESSRHPHNDHLCIGLYCNRCKELVIFELREMSLTDFAAEILEQNTSNNIEKRSEDDAPAILNESGRIREKRASGKSNITRKEVDDVREFLRGKNLSHEDFLVQLGLEKIKTKGRGHNAQSTWELKKTPRVKGYHDTWCRSRIGRQLDDLKARYSCDMLDIRRQVMSGRTMLVPTDGWDALRAIAAKYAPEHSRFIISGIQASCSEKNPGITELRRAAGNRQ